MLSLDLLTGRETGSGPGLVAPFLPSILLRFEDVFPRCRPGVVTLHLLTLSVRFIIALWTKPPIPLVGDAGRVGEVWPDEFPSLVAWISAGGPNFSASVVSNGEPSLLEPACEIGRSRTGSLSGSVEVVRDMPGSWEREATTSTVSSSSTWFLRYAAEVAPRSAVCRNQAGSLEANACEIWSREGAWLGEAASAGGVFDRAAAFSAATIDNGRDLGRSGPWDGGLRCHDKVGVLVGTPLDGGELYVALDRLGSRSRIVSFVGETERGEGRSIVSADNGGAAPTWFCSLAERSGIGDDASVGWDVESLWRADGGGVLAGDDFCGEMDRARSRGKSENERQPWSKSNSSAQHSPSQLNASVSSTRLTFATGLALLSLLQQFLFKLLGASLFFLVSSVVQLLY